ncbi:uncharacterized protein LOC131627543 [Vicia villosa]|uniref:uncharacterized protein LOC131627543 n=1 Tax=Vicia villosa TaxID=3911 RepID=UPI00273BCF52|nr:uncharacterized protein LOC131627543 [Vicia villosa]
MEGKRKRGGHREVDAGGNGKLKGKAIGSSEAPDAQSVDYEFTSISSNSNRVYTTIIVNQDEEYWVREVFDAKKMRKNVMQFPANVIDSCLLRQISNIVLLDCDKGEPYYCEIKKREEKKETYLCGAWFDYVRKADLKVGDKLHFVIRYPPVEEILVYVERRAATP